MRIKRIWVELIPTVYKHTQKKNNYSNLTDEIKNVNFIENKGWGSIPRDNDTEGVTWTNEYFKIYDFSHIECYVGNARQSLYYYCLVMGFKVFAYKGPETGCKEKVSYVLIPISGEIILYSTLITTDPSQDTVFKSYL